MCASAVRQQHSLFNHLLAPDDDKVARAMACGSAELYWQEGLLLKTVVRDHPAYRFWPRGLCLAHGDVPAGRLEPQQVYRRAGQRPGRFYSAGSRASPAIYFLQRATSPVFEPTKVTRLPE